VINLTDENEKDYSIQEKKPEDLSIGVKRKLGEITGDQASRDLNKESSFKTPGKGRVNASSSSADYLNSLSSTSTSPGGLTESSKKALQIQYMETNGLCGGVDEDTEDENED
jgi:hypothetical protein